MVEVPGHKIADSFDKDNMKNVRRKLNSQKRMLKNTLPDASSSKKTDNHNKAWNPNKNVVRKKSRKALTIT